MKYRTKIKLKEIVKHIIKVFHQYHNIDLSKFDDTFLLKSFQNRVSEKKIKSENEYLQILETNKNEATLFFDLLHNSYSEFFRNSLTFSVLERIIFPLFFQKEKQKEIRIWSAACAGGQEAYSIATLLEESKNNDSKTLSYRIFATDQCEQQLVKARNGEYEISELNNLSLKRVDKWFNKKSDFYFVKPILKKNIEFSQFDLFDENQSSPSASIFGDFDVIICANIFFYYKDEYRKIILEKIKKSISANGYLITGEAEREILIHHNFKEVFPKSAIFRI